MPMHGRGKAKAKLKQSSGKTEAEGNHWKIDGKSMKSDGTSVWGSVLEGYGGQQGIACWMWRITGNSWKSKKKRRKIIKKTAEKQEYMLENQ